MPHRGRIPTMSAEGFREAEARVLAERQWTEALDEIATTHNEGVVGFKKLQFGSWTQWRLDVTVQHYDKLAAAAEAAMAYALALNELRRFVETKR